MPAPSAPWVATPNKTDHSKSGYSTKVIYYYQYIDDVSVPNSNEVFDKIQTSGGQYKGSNTLPDNYFDTKADGRGFRITMYFSTPLDGSNLQLRTQVYNISNSVLYTIADNSVFTMGSGGGSTLIKYESYLSFYTVTGGPNYYISATGAMVFANDASNGTVTMVPFNNYVEVPSYTHQYRLELLNTGGTIYPRSLMVEEIS